jgi:ABC-type lipoprotein export system ATPase subunit
MTRPWSRGSEWHRWDPHLHTPSTLLNNQFKRDEWDAFLDVIEKADPVVEALGITDYCVLRSYSRFVAYRKAGRAKNVIFAFPNIEFRLGIETKAGKGVNVHLLFSPEDDDHIEQIERVLTEFKFKYKGVDYPCTPEWLIKLGRALDPKLVDHEAALSHGADQFKLNWDALVDTINSDAWARKNSLLAISPHEKDGISGLQHDSSFEAMREELKAQPDIIFSANAGDREFWLGRKKGRDRDFIEATYGSLKPCLHGSDPHKLEEVLRPKQDRLCWIKAELSFTGLKQTLIEPDLRVEIGPLPPPQPSPSECIRSLEVTGAPWLETTSVTLNDGLVAIVGPKGSGKTALADMIARAAGAPVQDDSSFLFKARDHLNRAKAVLQWADGTTSEAVLEESPDELSRPYVRYLSQQFVDRLCSADKLGGELLREIESVVFNAIPEEDRLSATSFDELRAIQLEQVGRIREAQLDTIQHFTQVVAEEDQNKAKLPAQEKRLDDLKSKIQRDENEMRHLLPKDKKAEVARLSAVTAEIEKKTRELQVLSLRATKQRDLERDHLQLREGWVRDFDELKARYATCGLNDDEWLAMAPTFRDEAHVRSMLAAAQTQTEAAAAGLRNGAEKRVDAELATWSLKDLQTLQAQFASAIGIEKERGRKHADLLRRVERAKQERDSIQKDIDFIRGADERRKKAIAGRRKAYAAVFGTFVDEHKMLEELYKPLKAQLAGEAEVERRLELHVRRKVDVEGWVKAGERLLDLRRVGPFQGHGSLSDLVSGKLVPAWKSGGADEVAAAMEEFINEHMLQLMKTKRTETTLEELGRWLFSTEHVSLEYGLRYEGVDLVHLSPGMRGIVLLILYLAIDRWDTRPLLVDQPEENLDPHSVYQELVRYFRAAKRRRQVIIVTHNPNLVVNADADQVIVASAERKTMGSIPIIRYDSGGLEDKDIRADVCRILEGGERAFLDRDRRYAIRRDRRR